MRRSLDADPMLLQLRMQLPERAQREISLVVFRILAAAKNRLHPRCRANHREKLALNVDLFPDRVRTAE